jgi:hypothetical protein
VTDALFDINDDARTTLRRDPPGWLALRTQRRPRRAYASGRPGRLDRKEPISNPRGEFCGSEA